MMSTEPVHRPTIGEVHATLMAIRPSPDEDRTPRAPTTLRGKGLRTAFRDPTTPEPRRAGRLVGNLMRKLTDRASP